MCREKFTPEQVIAALKAKHGMVAFAARALGCTSKTLYNMMNRHPEIAENLVDIRAQMLDLAESALFKQIGLGSLPAITFYLRTQGKDRGYVERTQFSGVNLNLSAEDLAKLSDEELNALISRIDSTLGGA